MRNRSVVVLLAVLLPCLALVGASGAADRSEADRFWPQWRGPQMTGVAPHANPPVEWSETKNVQWKVEIPGKGSATPIVWEDRLYILTAVAGVAAAPTPPPAPAPQGGRRRRGPRGIQPDHVQKFTILALERGTGKVLWERVLREKVPHEGTHATSTWASSSAATDGEMILAFFGSQGLYALDMEGNPLWEKDLGEMTVKLAFGEGSTPALGKDRVVVQWDHEGQSFIVALDRKTGRELWRRAREEGTSWASPLIVEHAGRTQIVTSATNKVRAYDASSGDVIWEASGMTQNAIPTPVYQDGLLILTSGFRGNALLAINLDEAKGDLSGSPAILWKADRDTPYVPSPLLYGEELYFLKGNNAMLSCFNARTGEKHYGPVRLEGVSSAYASLVGAGGRIYVAGREGGTAVIQGGPEFKLLATNALEEGFDASPVAVGSELYLRGQKHLYRISE